MIILSRVLSVGSICLLVLVALTSSRASPAAEVGVSDDAIVVGQSIALQGGRNAYGVAAANGSALYFDDINAAGGVHGRRIAYRVVDDDNSAATAERNAKALIDEGAFILFGSIEGGPSVAVMQVASTMKVPFFGPMAGSPTLRRPHQPHVFPVRAEHRDEFRALMEWGRLTGLKSVAFLHSDSDVGRGHLDNVKMIADELGMPLKLTLALTGDSNDAQLDAMVKEIAANAPDMMLNHGSSGVYQRLIAKARAAGLKTHFMGVNSGSTQIADGLGPLAHGMVFAQIVPNPRERKHQISREYHDALARRGIANPDYSYGALEGFMTAKALVVALEAAGPALTRSSFIKALESTQYDLGGVTMRFAPGDHEGSRFVDLSIVARDGRFVQ